MFAQPIYTALGILAVLFVLAKPPLPYSRPPK